MIAPRWRKVLRDIFLYSSRSLLAVLAMAAGLFEIGALLYKYAVLQPVLSTMYEKTHPASATLVMDQVDDSLVSLARRVPGVTEAEARPVILARVRIGEDRYVPAVLFVIRDFGRQRLDTFDHDVGAWPPGPGEVLLERTALSVAQAKIGDALRIRTSDGAEQTVRLAGTVHAAGLPPAWMEHMVPGFISWDSPLRRGADAGESAQLRIVADHPMEEGYVRELADSVSATLERAGHPVSRVTVPTPGRHPHADQMDAFLYLLGAFGILSFLLSAVLVASMIHALLAEQVRQVGILKAIGANTRQIAGMYLGQVALLGLAASALGIPAGFAVGRKYAEFAAQILNANLEHAPFPLWVVLAEIAIGVVVPVAFALGPVLRASRITVHQALTSDPAPRPFGTRRIERALLRLSWLSRPLVLSLRSSFLRRGRLALTILMLALGGASFLAAMNVAGAWTRAVREDFARRRYDLNVALARSTPRAEVEAVLAGVPEIARVEYGTDANPYLIGQRGVAGGTVAMVGIRPASRVLEPAVQSGRWLREEDTTGVVINGAVLARNPSLAPGGQIGLRYEGRTMSLPIVGVVKELSPMPAVYAPPAAVLRLSRRDPGLVRMVRVVTQRHDLEGQQAAARSLERAFEARGIELTALQEMLDVRKSILDHLVIILSVLTFASSIVLLVATLGLTSTLALNVLQRTREIGILSAIGARPRTVAGQVWTEAMLIGLSSWVLGMAIGTPITWALETACGRIFFKTPLDFYLSPTAAALWFGVVVLLASLSSVLPARRAARLTVREALSHS